MPCRVDTATQKAPDLRYALLLLTSLAMAADPTTWQHAEGGTVGYLTIQDGRVCMQQADGLGRGGMRLVPEGDIQMCYLMATPAQRLAELRPLLEQAAARAHQLAVPRRTVLDTLDGLLPKDTP